MTISRTIRELFSFSFGVLFGPRCQFLFVVRFSSSVRPVRLIPLPVSLLLVCRPRLCLCMCVRVLSNGSASWRGWIVPSRPQRTDDDARAARRRSLSLLLTASLTAAHSLSRTLCSATQTTNCSRSLHPSHRRCRDRCRLAASASARSHSRSLSHPPP